MKKRIEILKEKQWYWQGHIASWRQSVLSQAEYCRRQSLSKQEFWLLEEETEQDATGGAEVFSSGVIKSSTSPRALVAATDITGEEVHD